MSYIEVSLILVCILDEGYLKITNTKLQATAGYFLNGCKMSLIFSQIYRDVTFFFCTKSPYIMRLTISCYVSGKKIQFSENYIIESQSPKICSRISILHTLYFMTMSVRTLYGVM